MYAGTCLIASFSVVKLNEFADMTFDEFSRLRLMDPQDCSATHAPAGVRHNANTEPPSSVDWRSKGAVTHVKNQVLLVP